MTTELDGALKRMAKHLGDLQRLERELLDTRGNLRGLPGENALDVALERIETVRDALDQAEHELEIEDGLYLIGDDDE